jgi:hypothetical protein
MRATFSAHLILNDLITLIISVKSTSYEVRHCVILSILLLLSLRATQSPQQRFFTLRSSIGATKSTPT